MNVNDMISLQCVLYYFLFRSVTAIRSNDQAVVFLHASVPNACLQRCRFTVSVSPCTGNDTAASEHASGEAISDGDDLMIPEGPYGSIPTLHPETSFARRRSTGCDPSKATATAVLVDGTNVADLSGILGSCFHPDLDLSQSQLIMEPNSLKVHISVDCPPMYQIVSDDKSQSDPKRQDAEETTCQPFPASQRIDLRFRSAAVSEFPAPSFRAHDSEKHSEVHRIKGHWIKASPLVWIQRNPRQDKAQPIQGPESSMVSSIDMEAFTELWVDISAEARSAPKAPPSQDCPSDCLSLSSCRSALSSCPQPPFFGVNRSDRDVPVTPVDAALGIDGCDTGPDAFFPRRRPGLAGGCTCEAAETAKILSAAEISSSMQPRFPRPVCPAGARRAFRKKYSATRLFGLTCWISAVLFIRKQLLWHLRQPISTL